MKIFFFFFFFVYSVLVCDMARWRVEKVHSPISYVHNHHDECCSMITGAPSALANKKMPAPSIHAHFTDKIPVLTHKAASSLPSPPSRRPPDGLAAALLALHALAASGTDSAVDSVPASLLALPLAELAFFGAPSGGLLPLARVCLSREPALAQAARVVDPEVASSPARVVVLGVVVGVVRDEERTQTRRRRRLLECRRIAPVRCVLRRRAVVVVDVPRAEVGRRWVLVVCARCHRVCVCVCVLSCR